MTDSQLKYLELQERERSNRAQEEVSHDSLRLDASKLEETIRSNTAREAETYRANVAKETENFRSNTRREREIAKQNKHERIQDWLKLGQNQLNKHADRKLDAGKAILHALGL